MGYLEENKKGYEKAYGEGFGDRYPSSNLISWYFHYIKPELPKDRKLKMLDFGCSLGANTKFYEQQGFEVYGIDISELAIERCIQLNGFKPENFVPCNLLNFNSLEEIFNVKFDFVLCNQVLIYLDKKDAKRILGIIKKGMSKDGIISGDYSTINHDVFRRNHGDYIKGEILITRNNGKAGEQLLTYYVESKEDIREIFCDFKEICVKKALIELEGENEILCYMGKNA